MWLLIRVVQKCRRGMLRIFLSVIKNVCFYDDEDLLREDSNFFSFSSNIVLFLFVCISSERNAPSPVKEQVSVSSKSLFKDITRVSTGGGANSIKPLSCGVTNRQDLFVIYPLLISNFSEVRKAEFVVADATSRWLNKEVKMICRKKLDFMSHIAVSYQKTWKQNI